MERATKEKRAGMLEAKEKRKSKHLSQQLLLVPRQRAGRQEASGKADAEFKELLSRHKAFPLHSLRVEQLEELERLLHTSLEEIAELKQKAMTPTEGRIVDL